LPAVVAEIDAAQSTLLFTNTRNQAEVWYQQLLAARPDWAGALALHHPPHAGDDLAQQRVEIERRNDAVRQIEQEPQALAHALRLGERATALMVECQREIERATTYSRTHFEDPPEISEWVWTA